MQLLSDSELIPPGSVGNTTAAVLEALRVLLRGDVGGLAQLLDYLLVPLQHPLPQANRALPTGLGVSRTISYIWDPRRGGGGARLYPEAGLNPLAPVHLLSGPTLIQASNLTVHMVCRAS
jgi:hypothetical protein